MDLPCKRCLLKDLDDAELYRQINEYIMSIPNERRVSECEYRRRLSFCEMCEYLTNGICGMCGCFAEARAMKRDMRCALGADAVW
jgi:hypothetical protein